MNNRIRLAKFMFALDAVLGVLAVGSACLFGAAYNRHADEWTIFVEIFAPLAVTWALLCYCAYKGLTSRNVLLIVAFCFWVFCNVLFFPIGTAIAGGAVYLWRDFRKKDTRPVST